MMRRSYISLLVAALVLAGVTAALAQSGGGYDPVSYTHLTLPTTPYV
jgi:hypothetical protein